MQLKSITHKIMESNKPLKLTVTRVTLFAAKAKPAPRYGGLVPPFHALLQADRKSLEVGIFKSNEQFFYLSISCIYIKCSSYVR